MGENENYKVTLRSYGEGKNCYLSSTVGISCKHYDTFCKIVEAVKPILDDEDKKCKNKKGDVR